MLRKFMKEYCQSYEISDYWIDIAINKKNGNLL